MFKARYEILDVSIELAHSGLDSCLVSRIRLSITPCNGFVHSYPWNSLPSVTGPRPHSPEASKLSLPQARPDPCLGCQDFQPHFTIAKMLLHRANIRDSQNSYLLVREISLWFGTSRNCYKCGCIISPEGLWRVFLSCLKSAISDTLCVCAC